MSYPLVQFVSAPSLDADVRFDCNSVGDWSDDDRWPAHDGFTLGFPSLSGDPEAIGVQYGTRSIEFNLIVRATPDAAFGVFSRLSREVQRPRNWLMVQFSDFSLPVWFYTYRTEQQALDFENVSGVDDMRNNVWGIGVRLAADPFAQGERITLPAVTIANKTSGANPFHMTLPSIVGDAAAPVRLQVQSSVDWSDRTPMVSSIATDGGPYDGAPIVYSLQTANLGADASAWAASTAYPAGGYVAVDFITRTDLTPRVSDTTTVLPIGTYRIFVFAGKASADATYRFRGRHLHGSANAMGDSVDFSRAAAPTGLKMWVDLGEFTFPFGASMDDQEVTYSQKASFFVDVQRLSGSGSIELGALAYVPVETPWSVEPRMFFADFTTIGLPTNRTGEWDEYGEYRLLVTSSLPARSVDDATPPKPVGGLPMVVPGCTNTLTLLQQTDTSIPSVASKDNRDDVAATATVTISYAPRYLQLAGSETL